MKVLIDTNILISAAFNDTGVPYKAYLKAVSEPFHGVICQQNIDELRRVFNRKFPHKLPLLDRFLSFALSALEVIPVTEDEAADEKKVRDIKDRPILRAAIAAKVDIILTGDKDFLEAGLSAPEILTAAQFIQLEIATEEEIEAIRLGREDFKNGNSVNMDDIDWS